MGRSADQFLRGYDLTQAQLNVLIVLRYDHPDGCTQAELCRALSVRAANMTELIRRMESRDLITRGAHPDDERAWCVRLSRPGDLLLTEIEPVYYKLVEELMVGASQAELRQLSRQLEGFRERLEDLLDTVGAHSSSA